MFPSHDRGGGNLTGQWYKNYSKHAQIEPFYVSSPNLNAKGQGWDLDAEIPEDNKNYGLNLSFSVNCDITDFIIKNKNIWSNALLLAMKVWACNETVNSTRDASVVEKMKGQARWLLSPDGDDLRGMLAKEVNRIALNLSDLGSPCAPKRRQKGIRYGVV